MNGKSYSLAVRGMCLSLMMMPIILIVPIIVFMFPEMNEHLQKMAAKSGLAMIWISVLSGAVGLLIFLSNAAAVPPSERLRFLTDIKPMLWLNLIMIGGFIGLYLLRS